MKKEDRIQHILDSTLTLIGRKPLASIRTAEIARESGISEGALFKYFSSKDEILSQIMKRYENTAHPTVPSEEIKTVEAFRDFINTYLQSMVRKTTRRFSYLRLLLQVSMGDEAMGSSKYNQVKNGVWTIMEDRIKYGQIHWGFKKDINIQVQVRLLHLSVLMFFIEQEIFNAKEIEYFDMSTIKDIAIDNFFHLLSPN
ncbi:MAG: TetR/AcrR family transcriptional regulator [Candidatus Marinimicrobia bacterium]|nr:TetR/AcrR family transcriptional regulator [Candidatus Neomarinimicrobiota bacterium]